MSTYIKKHQKLVDIGSDHKLSKWLKEMAELKWLWATLNIMGYTAYVWALFISFANVDFVTRMALSIIGALFLLARLIVYCVASVRKHKLENLQIRREMNIEKALELRQRREEIETFNQETEIIKSYNGE